MGIRMKYNQAYSMTLRMVDRIENCEGYDAYKPWMIVGIIDEKNTNFAVAINAITSTNAIAGNTTGFDSEYNKTIY